MEVENQTVGQGFVNILKWIGFIIVASIPLQIIVVFISMQDEFSAVTNIILGIIYLIIVLLIIVFLWKKYFTFAKEPVQSIGWRDLGIAVLFFIATRIIAIVGTLFITLIHGEDMSANDQALFAIADNSQFYLILFSLSIGILVPIAEELTYRGIGVNLLYKKSSFWMPFLVTSIIFGVMHGPTNVMSFVIYLALGMLFFFAYNRRRNILDSILVHILNNILAAIAILFM